VQVPPPLPTAVPTAQLPTPVARPKSAASVPPSVIEAKFSVAVPLFVTVIGAKLTAVPAGVGPALMLVADGFSVCVGAATTARMPLRFSCEIPEPPLLGMVSVAVCSAPPGTVTSGLKVTVRPQRAPPASDRFGAQAVSPVGTPGDTVKRVWLTPVIAAAPTTKAAPICIG
jgi:hypothetical protein